MRARSLNKSYSDIAVTSSPKTLMVPESGLSRPLVSFIRTDLPQPAGPRMMRVSAGWTVREMFWRTTFSSKAMETFSKETTASVGFAVESGDVDSEEGAGWDAGWDGVMGASSRRCQSSAG